MTTNVDVVNRALAEIGTRSQISAMNDGSQEAQYASLLYSPFLNFLLRNGDYEFATSNPAAIELAPPLPPWTHAYQYPADGVRIRQLIPLVFDPLDPFPIEFSINSQGGTRVIATTVQVSTVIYTVGDMPPDFWDSMFAEAFTRYLGSGLIYALENGGAASAKMLNEAMEFAAIASLRDG